MRYAVRSAAGIVFAAALTLSAAACGKGSTGTTAGQAPQARALPSASTCPAPTPTSGTPTPSTSRSTAPSCGINLMPPTNSQNDVAKLVANIQALVSQGAKAIVMAPQDTGAIASTLATLESKKIPVVSVDTRPDKGKVYMVVRADNRAYGQKACEFLGEKLDGKGKVVEFQGALSSINGRDRSEAFADCMKSKFPGITVFARADRVGGREGRRRAADPARPAPRHQGHLHAGRRRVPGPDPAAAASRRTCSCRRTDPKHIFVVSNDGIPQEFDAIRKGEIDATVSQPADLYAKYALFYAKAAVDGKTFQPGPTDHDSHHRRGPQRRARGPAARAAGDQGQRGRQDPVGQPGRQVSNGSAITPATAGASAPAVQARGITKRYRRHHRARRRGHRRASRRDARAGRPQRRRQVDAGVDPDRAAAGRRGRGRASTASPRRRSADRDAWRQAGGLRLPEVDDHPDADRRGEPVPEPAGAAARPRSAGVVCGAGPRDLLGEYGVDVDPAPGAGDLTVEQRQLVEIARALSFGARFIILDEPTAQLDAAAHRAGSSTGCANCRPPGVAFLFISHHLQEVYEVCQTRHGLPRRPAHPHRAGGRAAATTALVAAMTGDVAGCACRARGGRRSPADAPGRARRAASLTLAGAYEDITCAVRAGRGGRAGRRRRQRQRRARRDVAGLRTADAGTVTVAGAPAEPGSVPAALARGHRLRAGGPAPRRAWCRCCGGGERHADRHRPARPGRHRAGRRGSRAVARRDDRASYDIKTSGPDQPVDGLSGGNQQKVVLARALASDPKALVLVSPTAGVDVRSKESLLGAVARRRGGRHRRADRLRRTGRPARLRPGARDVPRPGGRRDRHAAGPTPSSSPRWKASRNKEWQDSDRNARAPPTRRRPPARPSGRSAAAAGPLPRPVAGAGDPACWWWSAPSIARCS